MSHPSQGQNYVFIMLDRQGHPRYYVGTCIRVSETKSGIRYVLRFANGDEIPIPAEVCRPAAQGQNLTRGPPRKIIPHGRQGDPDHSGAPPLPDMPPPGPDAGAATA
ncbi:hypothetical protein CPC08DRAFT_824770 [Agrocybe pediades]|nr:hypothetical protein CPC08DRAFT_824770 [Agrocybe pediades]